MWKTLRWLKASSGVYVTAPRALIGCSGANQRWRGSASTWTLTLLLHNIIESLVFYDSRKRRTITYHYCQALKVKEERSFETKPTPWSRVIHTVTGPWVEKYWPQVSLFLPHQSPVNVSLPQTHWKINTKTLGALVQPLQLAVTIP